MEFSSSYDYFYFLNPLEAVITEILKNFIQIMIAFITHYHYLIKITFSKILLRYFLNNIALFFRGTLIRLQIKS